MEYIVYSFIADLVSLPAFDDKARGVHHNEIIIDTKEGRTFILRHYSLRVFDEDMESIDATVILPKLGKYITIPYDDIISVTLFSGGSAVREHPK